MLEIGVFQHSQSKKAAIENCGVDVLQFKDHASVQYPMLCYLQCKDVSPELRLLLSEYLLRVGVVFGATHSALASHLRDSEATAGGGGPLQQLLQMPAYFYSEKLRTVAEVATHLSLKEEAVVAAAPGAASTAPATVTSFVLRNYSEL